jgi:hypothetical protein
MNNVDVKQLLDNCAAELALVKTIVDGLGMGSNVVPFLTKYAIIRSCGAIEQSFKAILADFCSKRTKKQIKRYLERKVRDSSTNPTYSAISKLVKDFDVDWNKSFKLAITGRVDKDVLLTSLQSLVDARNEFAHGGNPISSIGDVLKYFAHSRTIIEELDVVVR